MRLRCGLGLVLLMLLIAGSTAGDARSAAANAELAPAQELHWLIPYPRAAVAMHATLRLPAGKGPFPLVVISHGTSESELLRQEYEAPAFDLISSWFLKRGYAVLLPQRPGHGETGGPYLESSGSCDEALYEQAGNATADAAKIAIDYAMGHPFVRRGPVLLVGHSAGAWGSLALAAADPQLVRAVINFSGGRGGHSYGLPNRNCAPERLVRAAAAFGRQNKVKTLWLYSANDSFFGPALSQEMAEAFRAAGGSVDYNLLAPMPDDDGHYLIFEPEGVPLWGPLLEKFLRALR
jgi:dienelactone hydrolase